MGGIQAGAAVYLQNTKSSKVVQSFVNTSSVATINSNMVFVVKQ